MRLARLFAALFAALAVSAAGPYTSRLAPQDLRHIRTVAVISAVGNTFLFQHVTNGRLEWLGPPDSHFLEISDWALDADIAQQATQALAKHFAVRPVAFVPGDFSSWDDALLKRAALDLNGDPAIDAYVFVLRDGHYDAIGHSVHDLDGLGIYRCDTRYGVFASYRIVLVDALTGDTIASRAALMPDGNLPWLPVDAALWPKTPNNLSEAQRARLVADETKLVAATLPRTLAAMGLAR